MNISQNIDRILYVLQQKGQIYKINSFQFYSEKAEKYCTKYQVLKKELVKVYNVEKNKIEYEERYKVEKESYSKVDILKYFMKEYKGMG